MSYPPGAESGDGAFGVGVYVEAWYRTRVVRWKAQRETHVPLTEARVGVLRHPELGCDLLKFIFLFLFFREGVL